jgi:pimeloyl-ACP methyl ester carboxylesterase
MTTFVCMHGAGGRGSDWALVGAELAAAGHHVVLVDMPCDQEVRLAAYTQSVVEAIDGRTDVVLIAHSLAGLIAPLVCAEVPVEMMILVAAIVPQPGETGGEWWANTGHAQALAAQDLPDDSEETLFVHDVPPQILAQMEPPRHQTSTLFDEPWPLAAWPDVPTQFLVCQDDRFFPAQWLTELVQTRLGIRPTVVPGGHCAYLSRPHELAEAVLQCWNGD